MANSTPEPQWVFTRPDPSPGQHFFESGLRKICSTAPGFNLPWRDDLYLAYPSVDAPAWPAFVAHIQQLNTKSDDNVHYKIVYVMRRAQKVKQNNSIPDPPLNEHGKRQCVELATNFKNATRNAHIPPPEVIFTSPLARALETTQLLVTTQSDVDAAFPSVRPIVLEGLREHISGEAKNKRRGKDWIGQNFPSFDIENVDEADQLGARYEDNREPDAARHQRVKETFAHIFEHFPDALVVMTVTHCYVQQVIQRDISGWDVPDMPEGNKQEVTEFFVGEAGGYAMVVKGIRNLTI